MSSSSRPEDTIPPKDWPSKDVIFDRLFSYLPASAIVMSGVSRYWNKIFKERQFWDQVLTRDYKFQFTSLQSLDPITLKKIYMTLASLEKTNPEFAKWYQQNIIETGADFSMLYKSQSNSEFENWLELDIEFNMALKVSNFEVARQLLFIMFEKEYQEPDSDTVKDMAKFGNPKAIRWLETVAGVSAPNSRMPEIDSDSDDDEDPYVLIERLRQQAIGETEEPGELGELIDSSAEDENETAEAIARTPDQTVLKYAIQSPNIRFIKFELNKASPEEVLQICFDIINDDDYELPTGLMQHGPEISRLLIESCIIAFKNKNASLEEVQQLLYPLAAFSGKIETFTWLNQELSENFISDSHRAAPLNDPADTAVIIAIITGNPGLVKWLIDPDGGKMNLQNAIESDLLPQVLKTRNIDMVLWYMSKEVADIKMTVDIAMSFAKYSELTKLLIVYLDAIKEGLTPPLSDAEMKTLLYTAVKNGNVPAVNLLLDCKGGNISLSANDKTELLQYALQSKCIAMFEFLTDSERGAQQIILPAEFLSVAINDMNNTWDDQNNLPALIHWLIDPKHGNLPVSANDIETVKSMTPQPLLTKNLIQGILERTVIPQNKLDITSRT